MVGEAHSSSGAGAAQEAAGDEEAEAEAEAPAAPQAPPPASGEAGSPCARRVRECVSQSWCAAA
eukprot:COSAG01_NODE_1888_length_8979_cov_78.343806_6_plen_64_part_00